jgi:DNA invertase Pin-like site-specific DNA recombinase
MVTRIERPARSIGDLQDIVRAVKAKGAALKATEHPSIPARRPGNASSMCSACSGSSKPIFGGQLEGIANAKAAGIYKGRPASIDAAKVRETKAGGIMGASEIANRRLPLRTRWLSCAPSSALKRTMYFLPVISFAATNHLQS